MLQTQEPWEIGIRAIKMYQIIFQHYCPYVLHPHRYCPPVFSVVESTNLILKSELRGEFQTRNQGEYGVQEKLSRKAQQDFHSLVACKVRSQGSFKVSKQGSDDGGPTRIILVSPLEVEALFVCSFVLKTWLQFYVYLIGNKVGTLRGNCLEMWEQRVGQRPGMVTEINFCFRGI